MPYREENLVGKQMTYRENGALFRVTVLSNRSDDEYVRYKLRVDHVIRGFGDSMHDPSKDPDPGHEFDYECDREFLGSNFIGYLSED